MNNVLTNVKLVLLNRFEKILFLKFLVESDKMASSGPYLNPARTPKHWIVFRDKF